MQLPSPCLGTEQVSQITALGVVVNDRMTASDHVTELLSSCTKLLYALRVLRAHGMSQQSQRSIMGWRGGLVVERRTCDLVVAGSRPGRDAAAQQP